MKIECYNCAGKGWYTFGEQDDAQQIQCEYCSGTGKVEHKPTIGPGQEFESISNWIESFAKPPKGA